MRIIAGKFKGKKFISVAEHDFTLEKSESEQKSTESL